MLERASAIHTLGLQRAGNHIRGVVLHYQRRRIVCEDTFILDGTNDQESVPPLFLTEKGKALERKAGRTLVVTAVDGSQTIVRQLDVKLKHVADIDAVLPFQAEPLLPFSAEEGQLDRIVLQTTEEGTLLTLLAVKRDQLTAHLGEWGELGIEPEVVGAVPHALAVWASTFQEKQEQPQLILHFGFTNVSCALVVEGKLIAAQSYRGGIHDLLQAYRIDSQSNIQSYTTEELADLNFNNIDPKKLPTLAQKFTQLQRDAVRTAFGLAKYAHIGDVAAIAIVGEGACYPKLAQALAAAIGKPQLVVNAPASFGMDDLMLARLAVPVGLALTALPNKTAQINFRQGTQSYPHPWKRLRWPLVWALTLCALLAIAAYFSGQAYLSWREYHLQSAYVDLVADLKRDYTDIEERMANQEGSTADDKAKVAVAPTALTTAALDRRLSLLERENASSPDTIALFPHVPRVSDVLTWLSSHPQVAIDPEAGASASIPIQLESFNYRMVKRPELNKLRDRYQVQVELEFSSQSARAARLFYDSLIAPNAMVDPKGEVKWTAANGKYRVSFFLKDKTNYPNP